MKHFTGNPETLDSINCHLETVIEIMEENELYYDWAVLHDIMCHGGYGALFHLETDYDDLPDGLDSACDDLNNELYDAFEGNLDLLEKFVKEFLEDYPI